MHRFVLGLIILLALLLRTIGISSYPVGFTQDEASFGYDAYSLLKTGKDQWGESWPMTLRSFGDFKLPLYTYLTIPSVAIFGLNEFATRLPNAILGTFAALVTYLLANILFNDKRIALVSALLLAVSPWHFPLSRGAFEANLTTFLVPLGVWAFVKGMERPGWMVASTLVFGLNLFSYHSARFFTPLLMIGLVWLYRKKYLPVPKATKRYKWSILVFLFFLIVAAYTMLAGAGARVSDVAIFNPTDRWAAVSDRRYEAVLQGLPDEISRIFSNKATFVFDRFLGGYVSYLSPQFLFTQGAGEWTYGMIPGRGVLYLIELPFVLVALWAVVRRPSLGLGVILLWLLLAPIPAALSKGLGFTGNRAAVMMPALQVFSAFGAIILYDFLVKRWHWHGNRAKQVLFYSFIAVLLASLTVFLEDYRYHAPIHGAESMLYGRKKVVEFVNAVESNYEEIVFSRSLSEPQIHVAFYTKWEPTDYQKETQDWLRYEEEGRPFLDQLGEYHLGKYTFTGIARELDDPKTLFIGKSNEFPQNTPFVKEIYYPDGRPAILIVDPSGKKYAQSN